VSETKPPIKAKKKKKRNNWEMNTTPPAPIAPVKEVHDGESVEEDKKKQN
jgi:hypothetical protein